MDKEGVDKKGDVKSGDDWMCPFPLLFAAPFVL